MLSTNEQAHGAPRGDETTQHEVVGIIAEVLKIAPETLSAETVLLDVGAESISLTRIAYRLEQRFAISWPRELTLPDEFTVDTMVRTVHRCLEEQGRATPAPHS